MASSAEDGDLRWPAVLSLTQSQHYHGGRQGRSALPSLQVQSL